MRKQWLKAALGLLLPCALHAQEVLPLNDLSYWRPTDQKNWQIAGATTADLLKAESMKALKGTGVLVNLPDEKNRANLLSAAEYGDVDVAFDFMMAKHSNSGFYLQGRYEVQLLDSWGKLHPQYGDCGGIYARRRFTPKEELFEGHAPRLNAAKAPGLWQHMEISFAAPRFDAAGKKIANARILFVRLNGVTVQENVELTGPTGGPISEQEAAKGPFMIQGDHGPVAFRNFNIRERGGKVPTMAPLQYEVIYGKFREVEEFAGMKPALSGSTDKLTWEITGRGDGFVAKYKTTLDVPAAGKYKFITQAGGNSLLSVNGKPVMDKKWTWAGDKREAWAELPAGKVPLELTYYKMDDWMPPMLALWIQAPAGAEGSYHTFSSTLALTPQDPILMDANVNTVFRSFMDFNKNGAFQKRIVHAVQVGSPQKLHYTYDLDNGAMAQIWRGDFLNTSPMWDNRGDGSSRPRGPVLALDDQPVLLSLAALDQSSDQPEAASAFRTLGYDLDDNNLPTFRYSAFGAEVNDQIRVVDAQYVTRKLSFAAAAPAGAALAWRLATGNAITEVSKGLYSIDGDNYMIRLPKGLSAEIRQSGDKRILFVKAGPEGLSYDIIW